MTERRNLQVLAWTGPVGIVLVLVGWMVLAGFLPPPSPNLSTQEVAALWQEDVGLKRFGLIMCVWGGALYVPFTIGVAIALSSAVPAARSLAIAQAAIGTLGTVFFTLNFFLLAMIPFRDRSPGVIEAMHDIGFSMTFFPVAPFTFQYLLIAAAIMQDRSAQPVFPRWTATRTCGSASSSSPRRSSRSSAPARWRGTACSASGSRCSSSAAGSW